MVLVSNPAISEQKLYKLVDESGKTHFSDQIAPEASKYRREKLNKEGQIIDVTEGEKTKEQQTRDNLLALLRQKQEKVIQNQKAHDASLLRSYHNKDEIINEMQLKLKAVEVQKKLIESELVLKMEQLDAKQKKAGTFERNSQPVPSNLVEEIKAIQVEIQKNKDTVTGNLALQKKITDEYEVNINRFLLLTQTPEGNESEKNKTASIEEADALGLFRCENDYQCKRAWEIARVFVDTHSTTPADINTDELVMHAMPTVASDFSLSISKITTKDVDNQLFLDIHCHESSLGTDLCNSKKIQELRSSFRPYVNERLSKVPTP